MPVILVVEKNGSIKEVSVKNYSDVELYKKAGLKNAEGFSQQASWTVSVLEKSYTIQLYGKTVGKATYENKYEFPPPVDSVLFFGSCILVNVLNNVVVDLSEKEWQKVYEFLYGGFEDMGSEDSSEEEEEDDDVPKTKEGYAKDGFIVDDNEMDDSDYSEEAEYVKPAKKPVAKKVDKKVDKPTKAKASQKKVEPEMNYLECTSELTFEEYI